MKFGHYTIMAIGMVISLSASANSPVAIVEDVQSSKAGVGVMDFLTAGQTIELGKDERLTIGYLNSCRRERITGGMVTIGEKQSDVKNGRVLREDVECDGGSANLSGQQAAKSGALAFRGAPTNSLTDAKVTIFGTSPMIVLPIANQHVVIDSVSGAADHHEMDVNGSFIDLSDHNISLLPNTTYRVVAGEHSTTFKIAPSPTPNMLGSV